MIIYAQPYEQGINKLIYDFAHRDQNTVVIFPSFRHSKILSLKLREEFPDLECTDRIDFIKLGKVIFYPIGDGSKIRGFRPDNIIALKYDQIPDEVLNTIIAGFVASSSDPVEKLKAKGKDENSGN